MSILASLSLGLSIGAGGAATGGHWWASYSNSLLETNTGLWRFCAKLAGTDAKCSNTWDIETIKDSRTYHVYFVIHFNQVNLSHTNN